MDVSSRRKRCSGRRDPAGSSCSPDTRRRHGVAEAAAAADLLVHEATFLEDELERARETSHSTAADAAGVARDAGVELLALTHLSNRYPAARPPRKLDRFSETVVPRTSISSSFPSGSEGPGAREGWSAPPP